jgi:hypothetical protein
MMETIRFDNGPGEGWILDHLFDVLENLEYENLENLLRIEAQKKLIRKLREEKIILARELELSAHLLSERTSYLGRKVA